MFVVVSLKKNLDEAITFYIQILKTNYLALLDTQN